MANLSDDELLRVVSEKFVDADTERSRINTENEYLNARNNADYYGTEVPGRSRFVSNDVKDANEAAHTSLVRMFLGAGSIIKFSASNPDNKVQQTEAEEKTAFVDWIIRGQTNSYKTQSSFLTNVLKLKAGIQKYYYEETESTEEFEWQSIQELEIFEQLTAMGFDLALDDEAEEADAIKLMSLAKHKDGEIVSHEENEDGTFDVKIKVTVKRQAIKIINVPTGTFLLSSGASDLDEAELVGDEFFKTRGELVAEGHTEEFVAKLPSSTIYSQTYRSINIDEQGVVSQSDFSEWASQLIAICDLYVKVDYNQDGIAERRHIQKAGDYILHNEAFNHVPYATASALIVPDRVIGEGWGEQVLDIQEVNTAITRGVLDNIYAVNNTKKVVRVGKNGVNLDEVLSPSIGGVIQAMGDGPLADKVQPILTEFIGDKALLVKQHMDQMKAQRVGNQLTSQGLDGDALSKETATRFTGIEKTDQAKVEKIARNVVEMGYRKLYEGVAWLAAHHQMDEVEFAVLGKALKANPNNWKFDSNVSTEVGLGAGDSDKVVQNMTGLWQVTQQLKAEGSPLTDNKKAYNILNKTLKAMDIKDTSLYLNDPEEPAELLMAENEQLNKLALQLQEQNEILTQQAENPLAEAEKIKQEAFLLKAESDATIKVAQLESDNKNFQADLSAKVEKDNNDLSLKLTDLEMKYGKDLNAEFNDNMMVFDPAIGDFI